MRPISTYCDLLQFIIATYCNLFRPIAAYFDILRPISTYINLFRHILTYFVLFRPISTYYDLLRPIYCHIFSLANCSQYRCIVLGILHPGFNQSNDELKYLLCIRRRSSKGFVLVLLSLSLSGFVWLQLGLGLALPCHGFVSCSTTSLPSDSTPAFPLAHFLMQLSCFRFEFSFSALSLSLCLPLCSCAFLCNGFACLH